MMPTFARRSASAIARLTLNVHRFSSRPSRSMVQEGWGVRSFHFPGAIPPGVHREWSIRNAPPSLPESDIFTTLRFLPPPPVLYRQCKLSFCMISIRILIGSKAYTTKGVFLGFNCRLTGFNCILTVMSDVSGGPILLPRCGQIFAKRAV